MSEYQHYEFYSIDKVLSSEDRAEISSWSSRAEVSARRAFFNYSYGDFREEPTQVLLEYFDVFFYLSNWGGKRVMFKFPFDLIDYDAIKQYKCSFQNECDNDVVIIKQGDYLLIDINFHEDESMGWIDGEGWLTEFISVRNDILNKDYRALFVVWLHAFQKNYNNKAFEEEDDALIPRHLIPPNLNDANGSFHSLINFFGIDDDWVFAAAEYSETKTIQAIDWEDKLRALSSDKRDNYLLRLLRGEENLAIKLKIELAKLTMQENPKNTTHEVIDLNTFLNEIESSNKKRTIAARKKQEEAHLLKMQGLATEKSALWKHVILNIEGGSGAAYDRALKTILDLKELASYEKKETEFKQRIADIKLKCDRKPAMMRRLLDNGL